MHKTKHYRKRNKGRRTTRKTRRNIKKTIHNKKLIKGGAVVPFSSIGDFVNSITHTISKGVDIVTVPPANVPPQKVGGDNPLPFKQTIPNTEINNFNID